MRTKEILNSQCLTGIFFTLWGILWLALYYENLFGKMLSGFFIVFGIFIFVKNYNASGIEKRIFGLDISQIRDRGR